MGLPLPTWESLLLQRLRNPFDFHAMPPPMSILGIPRDFQLFLSKFHVDVASGVNGLIGTQRPEQHGGFIELGGVGKVIDSRHDFDDAVDEADFLGREVHVVEVQGRAGFVTDLSIGVVMTVT